MDYCMSQGQEMSLTVWNRSQFEAHEIRIHSSADPTKAALEIDEPLPPGEYRRIDAFPSGHYLTYVRDENAFGPEIAVTTESPVCVESSGYTLVMFDSDFRLLWPDSSQAPEVGVADAADAGEAG